VKSDLNASVFVIVIQSSDHSVFVIIKYNYLLKYEGVFFAILIMQVNSLRT